MSGNQIAPEGKVWMCGACRKKSRDLYGNQALDYGWDESCVLNAVLVDCETDDEEKERGNG